MKNFLYRTNGGEEIELTEMDMQNIHKYYEIQATADYLRDNHSDWSEEKIQDVAAETRRQMDRYDFTEAEAIEEALSEYDEQNNDEVVMEEEISEITIYINNKGLKEINGWSVSNDKVIFDSWEEAQKFINGESAYDYLDNSVKRKPKDILIYAENENGEVLWENKMDKVAKDFGMYVNERGEKFIQTFKEKCGLELLKKAEAEGMSKLWNMVDTIEERAAWYLMTYDAGAIFVLEYTIKTFPDNTPFESKKGNYTDAELLSLVQGCIENGNMIITDPKFEMLIEKLGLLNAMPTELAIEYTEGYIIIQECTGGYDYTITSKDFKIIDGGIYDNPDVSIALVLNEALKDAFVRDFSVVKRIDYEFVEEQIEKTEKERIEAVKSVNQQVNYGFEESATRRKRGR